MSKKPLVRFYVRHSGFDAELFSVRERPGGDLIIKHRPIFYERAPFAYYDQDGVVTEYYSVHVSPNSSGHVLTHTKEMKRDGEKRTSWFVDCPPGQPFLTLLYSRRHTSLIERLFKCPHILKDTRIQVAEFDVQKCGLVTHVFVGARGGLALDAMGLPWDVITHRFATFEIHIVTGYVHYPSLEQGDHMEPTDRSVLRSLTAAEVPAVIGNANRVLCRTFIPRALSELMNASGAELAKVPVGGTLYEGPFIDGVTAIQDSCWVQRSPAP